MLLSVKVAFRESIDKLVPITNYDSPLQSAVHTDELFHDSSTVRVLDIHSLNDEYADPRFTDAVVRCLEDDDGSVSQTVQSEAPTPSFCTVRTRAVTWPRQNQGIKLHIILGANEYHFPESTALGPPIQPPKRHLPHISTGNSPSCLPNGRLRCTKKS